MNKYKKVNLVLLIIGIILLLLGIFVCYVAFFTNNSSEEKNVENISLVNISTNNNIESDKCYININDGGAPLETYRISINGKNVYFYNFIGGEIEEESLFSSDTNSFELTDEKLSEIKNKTNEIAEKYNIQSKEGYWFYYDIEENNELDDQGIRDLISLIIKIKK